MSTLESRNSGLKKLAKYGQKTKLLKSAVDGMKYVGKIKLIKRDENAEDFRKVESPQQKDLSSEFNYRSEMEESVAERLQMFKNKEQQNQQGRQITPDKHQKCTGKKSPGEPEYIQRERAMELEVERIFQQHQNGLFLKSNNNSSPVLSKHLATSSPNISRPHSDDSGLVDEDNSGGDISDIDREREEMNQAEKMFRNFSLQHKKTKIPSSSKQQEKYALLVRLELAEKRAEAAKESVRVCKLNKSFEDSLDAEESYHTTALEISRIKKELLAMETVKTPPAMKQESLEKFTSSSAGRNRSRECKFATQYDSPPPVDKSLYNDEGDCVPEGITTHRIQVFQC